VGVERDPRWVTQAREAATKLGLSDRWSFLQGVAEALPFADQSFDLVTCQTLLIHVADPAAVIAEMQRVVAPGGTVLLSEPNNLAGMLVYASQPNDQRRTRGPRGPRDWRLARTAPWGGFVLLWRRDGHVSASAIIRRAQRDSGSTIR
jgi:2-polyprenyl-3-methyl-5-hydroxy-6-metoxy-1,4-benzoquinol methylase